MSNAQKQIHSKFVPTTLLTLSTPLSDDVQEENQILIPNHDETKHQNETRHEEVTRNLTVPPIINPPPPPLPNDPIPAWLSCKFRLDKFNNKEQTFTITGWINVFWKMDDEFFKLHFNTNSSPHSTYQKRITRLNSIQKLSQSPTRQVSNVIDNDVNASIYTNNYKQKIMKIENLKQSTISYYVPIDPNRIFRDPTLQCIEHLSSPSLYHNKDTNLGHIQYHVKATLFEHLELHDFPFDRQFLNVKLKWNSMYFKLLNWTKDQDLQIGNQIFAQKEKKNKFAQLYHKHPLTVGVTDSLQSEIDMLDPWIDFNAKESKTDDEINDKYVLIRLRIKRNPRNFCLTVLIPFFIIVSCSFTIFAIDDYSIADRLGVSVTILLTFTAFQNMVDEELPKSSDTEFIDKYILIAYLIQGLIIVGACLLPNIVDGMVVSDETHDIIEDIWIGIIVTIWIGSSLFYVLKGRNVWKDQEADRLFWENRAREERREWEENGRDRINYEEFCVNGNEKDDNKCNIIYSSTAIRY